MSASGKYPGDVASLAYVGVSGFGYPSWRGDFYPEGARPGDFLKLYAERLPSVELNATGRRFPRVDQLSRWAEVTPTSFTFAVKLTGAVVNRPGRAGRFCDAVRTLGQQLGPVLVQLPALGRHDADLAGRLFDSLAPDLTYAIELKDEAWDVDSVRELAQPLKAVVVDEPLPNDPFVYHRFREPPYGSAELETIAASLRQPLSRGVKVFGYFKHEDEPTGPRYARSLLDLLHDADSTSSRTACGQDGALCGEPTKARGTTGCAET